MDDELHVRQQESKRLHSYELEEENYTARRYTDPAMQFYADLRTARICDVLNSAFAEAQPIRILDVGCGTGVQLDQIAGARPNVELYGIDFSSNMLGRARESLAAPARSTSLCRASAFHLPFADGAFHAVIATRFIHQYTNDLKRQLLREMERCTRPGGVVIVEFYSYIPWLVRYPLERKRKTAEEWFKHCPRSREVAGLVGVPYRTVPLMLPGSTRVARFVGLPALKLLRAGLARLRVRALFDQYLVVYAKDADA